jgi:four helix bundle protein
MVRRVERFEDLIAWEKAMDLAVLAYELTALPRFKRDFALSDQVHRAAISVPANIAEGFEHGTRSEFHRFLTIAKASCGELRTHLYLAERVGYLDKKTARDARAAAEEVSRIISGLRTSVAKQKRTPKP